MPPRVRPPLRRDAALNDRGFSLVEALVSLTLLAVVGTATMTALAGSTATSKTSSDRLVAADLAQQDLQAMMSLRWPDYPAATPGCDITVKGTRFRLVRTVTDSANNPTPVYSTAPATTAPVTSASTSPTAGSASPSATVVSSTPAPTGSPTGSPTTSPTTSPSGSITGSPTGSATSSTGSASASPSSTAPPATLAPAPSYAAPSSQCDTTGATSTSAPTTSTTSTTPTPTSSDDIPPCPNTPTVNFDGQTSMIVSTTVLWGNSAANRITLKALIAC